MRGLTYRISFKNINTIKFDVPQDFKYIMMDTNLMCNLHCLYCHNDRSTQLMAKEDFERFIDTQVASVDVLQLGCAMEPTMDKRLLEFARIISTSKAKPKTTFRLQTNALLLDRFPVDALKSCGINLITISLDTLDPETHKILRGGSDLSKVLTNIENLRNVWSDVNISLVTTVNKLNLKHINEIARYGVDNKINNLELRKMFYYPDSRIIQAHDKMQEIFLDNEVFSKAANKIRNKYEGRIEVHVNDEVFLNQTKKITLT